MSHQHIVMLSTILFTFGLLLCTQICSSTNYSYINMTINTQQTLSNAENVEIIGCNISGQISIPSGNVTNITIKSNNFNLSVGTSVFINSIIMTNGNLIYENNKFYSMYFVSQNFINSKLYNSTILVTNNIFNNEYGKNINYGSIYMNKCTHIYKNNIFKRLLSNDAAAIYYDSSSLFNTVIDIFNNTMTLQNSTRGIIIRNSESNDLIFNMINNNITTQAYNDKISIVLFHRSHLTIKRHMNNTIINVQNNNIDTYTSNGTIMQYDIAYVINTTFNIKYNTKNFNIDSLIVSKNILNQTNFIVNVLCNRLYSDLYRVCPATHTISSSIIPSTTKQLTNSPSISNAISPSITLSESKSESLLINKSNVISLSKLITKSDSNSESLSKSLFKSNIISPSKIITLSKSETLLESKSLYKSSINTQSRLQNITLTKSPFVKIHLQTRTIIISSTKIYKPSITLKKSLTQIPPKIEIAQNNNVLPKSVETTINTISSSSVAISTIVQTNMALQTSKMYATLSMYYCNANTDSVSYSDYQVQPSIGTSKFARLNGSILFACMIIYITYIICSLGYLQYIEMHQYIIKVVAIVSSFSLSYYSPLILRDSMVIINNDSDNNIILAVICFTTILLLIMHLSYMIIFSNKFDDILFVSYYGKYYDASRNNANTLIRSYYLIDLIIASIFAIIDGNKPSSGNCTINISCMVIINLVYCVYVLSWRPYIGILEQFSSSIKSILQLSMSILTLVSVLYYDMIYYITILVLCLTLQFICDMFIMIGTEIYKKYYSSRNNIKINESHTLAQFDEQLMDEYMTLQIKDDSMIAIDIQPELVNIDSNIDSNSNSPISYDNENENNINDTNIDSLEDSYTGSSLSDIDDEYKLHNSILKLHLDSDVVLKKTISSNSL